MRFTETIKAWRNLRLGFLSLRIAIAEHQLLMLKAKRLKIMMAMRVSDLNPAPDGGK